MKESRGIIRNPLSEAEIQFEPSAPPSGGYSSYRNVQTSDGFQLADYWRAIRKRLWLVIGLAVLLTTLTAIYMARQPSVFSAHGVVQVDSEQANPDLVTSERQRPGLGSDPAYFNTQLQLLLSDNLLRRTIKEQNLDTHPEFLKLKDAGSTSTFRSILRSIGLATDDSKAKTPDELLKDNSLLTTEEIAEAARLQPFVKAIKLTLDIDPRREPRATVKDTRLIDISYRHTSPELAAFVVNSIANTFTEINQEKRSGTSKKTKTFLEERITTLESEVQSDEAKLVRLTQEAGILKTDGDQTIVLERLAGLNKQLLDAEQKRKAAEAEYLEVTRSKDKVNALTEAATTRYTTEQESGIRSLQIENIKRITDLKTQRREKLELFEEGAPELKQIDDQIKAYQDAIDRAVGKLQTDLAAFRSRTASDLVQNLRTKYLQAKAEEDKIRVDFDKQYGSAQGQNTSAVDIKLLQQNIDTKKGFLENLRKQVSGNLIAAQGTDNNISVSEIAIPPDIPVSPRRLMTVLAALFLSTLFGMGLALFLEYLDDTIRTTEEIESYLQLPALAAIPAMESMPKRKLLLVGSGENDEDAPVSPLLISADSRSSLAEAYRHLRTSILLSTAGHAPKSLLITSSLPSEGKTTTATNTAISLAQTGARVLIIDADMRRPRLHSIFGVGNGNGLSTLLSSELTDIDITSAIKVDEKSKLFLLTSGPIPPNPAELVGSAQMATLLKMLQARFTHVVVDSPPIASFTDGVLIASMVDGVILVVNAGRTSRQVVKRSRQLLTEIGAKVFGVLLNNANLQGKDSYYYYQNYYQADQPQNKHDS
ncbi:MAG: polysaccharide biosynthesis tyrosine autokinase [Pyrinomonadaceae bacterium]